MPSHPAPPPPPRYRLATALFGLTALATYAAAAQAPAPAATPFSQILAPSLTQITAVAGSVHPDKWKLSGDLHQRTDDNLHSISGDITNTLPALITAADTPPSTPASILALSRNLDALYDVLLRVTIASDLSAPEPQRQSLDAALGSLNDARRSLADRLRAALVAQTQQLDDVQASLAHTSASLTSANATIQALSQPKPATRSASKPRPHTHHKPVTPPASTPPPQTP